MDQPNSPILGRIVSLIEDRREMEQSIQEIKDLANELVSQLAEDEQKLECAEYLYWLYPEIRAKEIALFLTGETNIPNLLNTLSSVAAGFNCDRCNEQLEIKSRSQLTEFRARIKRSRPRWAEGFTFLCPPCEEEVLSIRHEHYERQEALRQQRLHELRTMPYKKYLTSPEWKERRVKHLKSAGFRCQVCNSPQKPLDVHHRTYERRGNEFYKDLVVLCRNCHSTFHENGSLVR